MLKSEYILQSRSSELPFVIATVNEHLKESFASFAAEPYLTLLISGVVEFFEKFTSLDVFTKTYINYRNDWLVRYEMRRGRMLSITSIKYLDVDGVEQTVSNTLYYKTLSNFYSDIVFRSDFTAPILKDEEQAIRIEFTSGFGANLSSLPKDIQVAMLQHLAILWQNRGDCPGDGALATSTWINKMLPATSRMIYEKYKVIEIAI